MIRISFSPRADVDLEEIIGAAPRAFKARPELGAGLRCAIFGNYLLFYTHDQDAVTIQRIMHGARDISPEDFPSA